MLLMIDNYDSFTYNVVQYFGELKVNVEVVRNDEITVENIAQKAPDYLVISPGPCTPSKAGISLSAIKEYAGQLPILGICLGHQSIAQAFGGKIVRASKVMHGKTSPIYHNNKGVFSDLPMPFQATRYHSLVIGSIDEIMGIKHKTLAVEGVQFHPESILTEHGHQLFNNFLTLYKP
jgi:anthranilate synthase component 2